MPKRVICTLVPSPDFQKAAMTNRMGFGERLGPVIPVASLLVQNVVARVAPRVPEGELRVVRDTGRMKPEAFTMLRC